MLILFPSGNFQVWHALMDRNVGACFLWALGLLGWAFAQPAWGLRAFDIHEGQTVYGAVETVVVREEQTLLDLARDHDLGYNQIIAANPSLDPWTPQPGISAALPLAFVLPQETLPEGIVINLAEMRLYYFLAEGGEGQVVTAPVGVGWEGFDTELGIYTIRSKVKDPIWFVPPSVRKEQPGLPAEVLPGPDNPLGGYILRFSRLAYGVHGTNRPWGIGRRVSHGCIRLYPEDISKLFAMVRSGTLVRVTYEPIKVGWADGRCWIQVYEDYARRVQDPLVEALMRVAVCETALGPLDLDLSAIQRALHEQSGLPVQVAQARQREPNGH